MKKNKYVLVFIRVITALCMTLFVFNTFEMRQLDLNKYREINNTILRVCYHFGKDMGMFLDTNKLLLSLTFIAFIWLLSRTKKITHESNITGVKLSVTQHIFSIMFSCFTLLAYSFSFPVMKGESLQTAILYSDSVQIIKTVGTFITWYIIFNIIQKWLIYFLKSPLEQVVLLDFDNSKLGRIISKHPFFAPMMILIVLWLPIILVNYPAIMPVDALTQVAQFDGYRELRTDHPLISTVLIVKFLDFGVMIGNGNIGIFLYALLQNLFLIISLSYSCFLIQKLIKKPFMTFMAMLVYSVPLISSFGSVVTKDVFFSGFFMIFITALIHCLTFKETFIKNKLYIIFCLSIVGSIMFRKNVMYAIIPSIIIYSILLFIKNKNLKQNIIAVLLMFLSVLASFGFESLLNTHYGAQSDVLRREVLSIPFQQTARLVKYKGDKISSEDKKIIDEMLVYNTLSKRYNPKLADPVKNKHTNDVSHEAVSDYFTVWKKYLMKYPGIYLEATLDQNISLFTIGTNNNYYNHLTDGYREHFPDLNKIYEVKDLNETKRMRSLQTTKESAYYLFDRLPIIGYLDDSAVYIIIGILLFGLSISFKMYRYMLVNIPMILLLASLIAGPIVYQYPRYLFIFAMLVPLLFVYLYYLVNLDKNNEERQTRTSRLNR